jgi:hypothetical protein
MNPMLEQELPRLRRPQAPTIAVSRFSSMTAELM